MYIHFFSTETRYSKSLIECLYKHLDLKDHLFVFGFAFAERQSDLSTDTELKDLNQIRLKNPFEIYKILIGLFKSKRIYIHLFPYDPTLLFWGLFSFLLVKTTWIEWGTDIYSYFKKDQGIKNKIYEWLRRRIFKKVNEIAGFIDQDLQLIQSLYHTNADFVPVLYPIPVNLNHLDNAVERKNAGFIQVLVGNSADVSNNHEEILHMLTPYRDEKMHVYIILSYGGNKSYIDYLINLGYEIFGDKFFPVTTPMNPLEYANFLNRMDVGLMNHQRQQGLGNILALLYLGKKVYLRNDVTSFQYLTNHDISIFNINQAGKIPFVEFSAFEDKNDKNRIATGEMLSEKNYVSLWSNLFNRH